MNGNKELIVDDPNFRTRFLPVDQGGSPEYVVDIVFVSGLDSHLQPHTSTWGTPTFFWPKDLGRIIPNARIMVWEVAREKGISTQEATSHLSERLLYDLVIQRGNSEIPLIFIAHSLGGLIVKSALLKAERSPLGYSKILHLTRGVCFFGTPQAWGRETWQHAIMAVRKALAARSLVVAPDPTDAAESAESEEIRDESRLFRRLVNRLSISILSFYETETTPTNRGKAMIVGIETAQLRTINEQLCARHANHFNIAKFYNGHDRDYRRVRDFISMIAPATVPAGKLLTSMGKTTAPSIHESETAAVETELLHSLHFDWLSEDMVADCDPRTCDWLLEHPSWKLWLSQSKEVLWIFGLPGMGKSVLAKFILQEIREQNRNDSSDKTKGVICYWFDDRVEIRRSFNGLIRALLYHFLLSDSELFRHIRGKYISTSPSLTNDYLMEILTTILEDSQLGDVDLIIEGLDECSDATQPEMVAFVNRLKANDHIRLIVTARPQDRIKQVYQPRLEIDLDSNANSPSSSVKLYIKEEIKRVLTDTKFPKDFQSQTEDIILSRPSPNYLWVRLALRYIELQRTTSLSRQAINDLPHGSEVNPLFEKYLETEFLFDKVPLPAVHIVMEAKTPMTVLGLSFLSAATFDDQFKLLTKPNLKMSDIEESTIRDFEYEIDCFPFLHVRNSTVSLMHNSLRDILKSTFSPLTGFHAHPGRNVLTGRLLEAAKQGVEAFLAALNYFIAELCLTYLIASLQESQDPLDFLRYSTLYWVDHILEGAEHARKWKEDLKSNEGEQNTNTDEAKPSHVHDTTIEVPNTLLSLVRQFFRSEKTCKDWTKKSEGECRLFTKWIRQYGKYDITKGKTLPMEDTRDSIAFTLAAFDLYHILGDSLINSSATNYLMVKDNNHRTPMHFIVLNNALSSLRWVQSRLASDSAFQQFHILAYQSLETDPENLENCPVYLAAEYGNKEMVAIFTNHSLHASLQSRRRLGRLLHAVTANNRRKDIFLLLYEGQFLDLPSEDQQSVAESAATLDCADIVKKIIEEFPTFISLITLLLHAIRASADKTLDFLLPQVDINCAGPNGRTALHEAAEVGNDKIIMKLLSKRAFVNSLDSARQTPLHLAAKAGFSTVTKLLLDNGARVNVIDAEGSLPIHYAAANTHDKVLSLLIDKGSNPFAADKNGRAPLHLACQAVAVHESSGSTVQRLLSLHARVGCRDSRGRTCMHYAAASGNLIIVWMLVDAGADLSVQDDAGVAPLHLAAAGSSDIMIDELIRLGADKLARDNATRSVYHYCFSADRPSRAVFQALMRNGVPVNVDEISPFAKSREWLDEFRGLLDEVPVNKRGVPISLKTQTSGASTEDLVMGGQVFKYEVDRVESPEKMFRDLDAALDGGTGARKNGASVLYVH